MTFKTFEADSFENGLKLVKKEMGADAIIVSTRTKKPNLLKGSFSKKIEIVAAYDDGIYSSPESEHPLYNPKSFKKHYYDSNSDTSASFQKKEFSGIFTKDLSKKRAISKSISLTPFFKNYFRNIGDFERFFRVTGIHDDIISILISEISEYMSPNHNLSPGLREKAIIDKMSSLINIPPPLAISEKSQRVIVLTGPTGVGKTTTIAKIAAEMSFLKEKKVGFITVDSYRIAATKQLLTYADIMDIELQTAHTRKELQNVLKSFHSKDLVLIDTAGHSHRNSERIKEINEMFKNVLNIETWLLIAASTKTDDAIDIVHEHSITGISGLIYTKLDETSSYETLYNTSLISGLPVFYFTTGQEVPQDIEEASGKKIINSLFNKFMNRNSNYKNLEI